MELTLAIKFHFGLPNFLMFLAISGNNIMGNGFTFEPTMMFHWNPFYGIIAI